MLAGLRVKGDGISEERWQLLGSDIGPVRVVARAESVVLHSLVIANWDVGL